MLFQTFLFTTLILLLLYFLLKVGLGGFKSIKKDIDALVNPIYVGAMACLVVSIICLIIT